MLGKFSGLVIRNSTFLFRGKARYFETNWTTHRSPSDTVIDIFGAQQHHMVVAVVALLTCIKNLGGTSCQSQLKRQRFSTHLKSSLTLNSSWQAPKFQIGPC